MEIAIQGNDNELLESYKDLLRTIRQSNYKSFRKTELEALWHLADTGARTCDFLIEQSTQPEQFEKANEVKAMYENIKSQIQSVAEVENKKKRATNV